LTSDGIVYIERGTCLHGVQACLAMSVVVSGPNRILRVVLDTKRDHEELLASIGHELQHAVGALGDPAITTNRALLFFQDNVEEKRRWCPLNVGVLQSGRT
jgi:hypothetical protein